MEKQERLIELRTCKEVFVSFVKGCIDKQGVPDIPIRRFTRLNNLLWGVDRKKLYVIGGRTSQGKTTFAINLAVDAAMQGFKVRYLSLEQDEEEIVGRIFSHATGVSYKAYRQSPDQYKQQAESFYALLDDILEKNLLIAYGVGKDIDELDALTNDLEGDMVIVDYVQAVKSSHKSESKIEAINNYVIGLRSTAVRKNFCAILISQINREAEDTKGNKPNLWQLKGSGTIEEHADVVMLCHYPFFYTSDEKNRGEFQLIVAKNRQGETGSIRMRFNPLTFSFDETNDAQKEQQFPDMSGKVKRTLELFPGSKVVE